MNSCVIMAQDELICKIGSYIIWIHSLNVVPDILERGRFEEHFLVTNITCVEIIHNAKVWHLLFWMSQVNKIPNWMNSGELKLFDPIIPIRKSGVFFISYLFFRLFLYLVMSIDLFKHQSFIIYLLFIFKIIDDVSAIKFRS